MFTTKEDSQGNLVPRASRSVTLASSSIFVPLSLPIHVQNPNGVRISVGVAVKGLASNQIASSTLVHYDEGI